MCGIAGWLGSPVPDERCASRVVQALRHRGPDADGIESWSEATLIHTRLSIIDLSPAGQQPIANENGTVWTVFNGEIYNHRELRRDLENRGHVFRGHSDTEVLPHLYEEYGVEFAPRLRGMFALAIYDTRARRLLLMRDRFGIKPLFYAPGKGRLAFASEIRALSKIPDIDMRLDRQAVYDFAALFYIPAPETIYKGIRAIQPGETLECHFDGNEVSYRLHKYHKWSVACDSGISFSHAVDRADELLKVAVQRQLESEVPLGSLLSGGIDSSLVSVAAQAAVGQLSTFNVGFSEKEYDETWAAVAVAKHIGSDHKILEMEDHPGTWEQVTALLRHAGQPFADTSLFAANAVCRVMRQYVTVALSGDGGDEAFGGYDQYWRIADIARLQQLPLQLWRMGTVLLSRLSQFAIVSERLSSRVSDLSGADDTQILQTLHCWIREREHKYLCIDTDMLPIRRLFEPQWDNYLPIDVSRLERLSMQATEVRTRLMLPNDYLFKVDSASMRESLEIRVPMLDEDLFAFGLSLPHCLKVKGRTCKRVLRGVAKRWLPPVVANKPKQGFTIPVDGWVTDDFKAQLKDKLLGPSSKLPEFFRPQVYAPLVTTFCDDRPHPGVSRQSLYQRAIMFLALQVGMEKRVH
jgi:asparagine synthase (glutamine-hydrolysing)